MTWLLRGETLFLARISGMPWLSAGWCLWNPMNPQDAALGPRKDEGTLKVLVGSIQDGIPQRRSFRLQVAKNLITFLTSIQRTEFFSQMAPHCNLHQDLTVSVFPIYIVFPVTSGGDCYVFFWCIFWTPFRSSIWRDTVSPKHHGHCRFIRLASPLSDLRHRADRCLDWGQVHG